MNSFSERTSKFIKKERLFDTSDRLLCAVSGGVDSMALLHVLRKLKYSVVVGHINYRLRGQDSDDDAALVKEYCHTYDVPFHSYSVTDLELSDLKKGNLQEKARILRYEWFENLRLKEKCSLICTAHHIDDSVETFLLNLLRGAGMSGLSGIAPSSALLRRPLLDFNKSDILTFVNEEGIPFQEDVSNSSNQYDRNFVRNKVLPLLKERWPQAKKSIQQSSDNLKRSNDLLSYFIDEQRDHWLTKTEDSFRLGPIHQLKSHPNKKALLYALIKYFGFTFNQVDQIIAALNSTGAIFHSSHNRLLINRSDILIQEKNSENNEEIFIDDMGSWSIGKRRLVIDAVDEVNFDLSSQLEYIDASKATWPLTLRKHKIGDRMKPLGMKSNSKLISDILIDKKINQFEKRNTYVLCNNDGRIIWLVGLKLSEEFKLAQKEAEALRLQWT